MANRRCLGFLARHCLLYPSSKTPIRAPSLPPLLENPPLTFPIRPRELERFDRLRFKAVRGFSSTTNVSSNEEEGELVSDDEEVSVSNDIPDRKRLIKEEAAAEVGYRVVGPLDPSEHPFNPYEPVFAVVQLILNKVLMLGSRTQTIIGRPILPDTAIHAVVEEHALDAKVIIFKKKRRKNYRRT